MGIITVDKIDHLYWLGRYTERVYTTCKEFISAYDRMIDEEKDSYDEFCERLNILNVYVSRSDFIKRYPFDREVEDSIAANLERAYDNAIVLRDILGSETLSYNQLAVNYMNMARDSIAPLIGLQNVIDCVLAFWGSVDDTIEDEQIRNFMKIGKRVERLDLYLRFELPLVDVEKGFGMLCKRLERTNIDYDKNVIEMLGKSIKDGTLDYKYGIEQLESLIQL